MMLKGICPKCGREYYGWALQNEQHHGCGQCGGRLHVVQESSAIKRLTGQRLNKLNQLNQTNQPE